MAELNKRWERNGDGWILRAPGIALRNRALIDAPTDAGYYRLRVWGNDRIGAPGDWITHMKSKDLRTLKAIGRIEATRRLP